LKIRLIIIIITFPPKITCLSQNLVPNPGFEIYVELPCRLNEHRIQELLKDWFQPTPNTTDYWNSLSPPDCYLYPDIGRGTPRNGNGMTGIITAGTGYSVPSINESKEYLEVKLLEPLKIGQLYEVEFYVTRPKSTILTSHDLMESNNLGMAFSVNRIFDFTDDYPVYLDMVSKLNETEIISEKGEWRRIHGCIYADSAYQYLLIGNFYSNSETLIRRTEFKRPEAVAYYFIDDVSVIETSNRLDHLESENIFCYNQESISLNATVEGAIGYLWDNGSNQPERSVADRITKGYSIKIEFMECNYVYKFNVESVPDVYLGKDTILCSGEVLTLAQNYLSNEITWWDGTKDTVKTITQTGSYWAMVDYHCAPSDSLSVRFLECPGFVPNVITSNGDGRNEYFQIENIFNRKWSLHIYNRWGLPIYQNDSYANDWNGGNHSSGVYFYILYSDDLHKTVKGWIELIR